MRNYLYPKAGFFEIWQAFKISLAGALIAGVFGIIHDQVTYSISPEYFTRMKFDQFSAADFGFPPRVLVAEIGFLATWWVGWIASWFLARVAWTKFENPAHRVFRGLAFIMMVTITLAIAGYLFGPSFYANRHGWREDLLSIGVTDWDAFSRVSAIHWCSYGGALVGWLVMMARWILGAPSIRLPIPQSGDETQPSRSDS